MSFINTLQNQRDLTSVEKQEKAQDYVNRLRDAASNIRDDAPKYLQQRKQKLLREARQVENVSWFDSPELYKQSQKPTQPSGTYIPQQQGYEAGRVLIYDPAAKEAGKQATAFGYQVKEEQPIVQNNGFTQVEAATAIFRRQGKDVNQVGNKLVVSPAYTPTGGVKTIEAFPIYGGSFVDVTKTKTIGREDYGLKMSVPSQQVGFNAKVDRYDVPATAIVDVSKEFNPVEPVKMFGGGEISASPTGLTGKLDRSTRYIQTVGREGLSFGKDVVQPFTDVYSEISGEVRNNTFKPKDFSKLSSIGLPPVPKFLQPVGDPSYLPKTKTLVYGTAGAVAISQVAPVLLNPAVLIPAATVSRFTFTGQYPTIKTFTTDTAQIALFAGIGKGIKGFKNARFQQKIKVATGAEWSGRTGVSVFKKSEFAGRLVKVDYLKPGFPVIEAKTGAVLTGRQTQIYPKMYDYLNPFTSKGSLATTGSSKTGFQYTIKDWQVQTEKQAVIQNLMSTYTKKIPSTKIFKAGKTTNQLQLKSFMPKRTESGKYINLPSGDFKKWYLQKGNIKQDFKVPISTKEKGFGDVLKNMFGNKKASQVVYGEFNFKTKSGFFSSGKSLSKVKTTFEGKTTFGGRSSTTSDLFGRTKSFYILSYNKSSRLNQVVKTRTKTVQATDIFNNSGRSLAQLPVLSQSLSQNQRVKLLPKQRTKSVYFSPSFPSSTGGGSYTPKPPRKETPPSKLPVFKGFTNDRRIRRKSKKGSFGFFRPFKYTASLRASEFNIFGKKPKRGAGGIGLRPLISKRSVL